MRHLIACTVCGNLAVLALYIGVCVVAGGMVDADQAVSIAYAHWIVFLGLFLVASYVLVEWAGEKPLRIIACGVLLVLIGLFVYPTVFRNSSPEQSMEQARTAYMQRDLATFRRYVDVNAVLSDGIDQIIVSPLAQSAAQPDGGGILAAGVAVTAASWKQLYLPALSEEVEQFVVSGSVPSQSQDNAFEIAVGSELLRMLATSQLTYEGLAGTKKLSNSVALVTVRVGMSSSPQSNQGDAQGQASNSVASSILLTFKMRSAGTHWQIVGIQNLPELAKELLS